MRKLILAILVVIVLCVCDSPVRAQFVPVVFNPGASSPGGWTPTYETSGNCNSGGYSCTVSLSVTSGWTIVCFEGSTSPGYSPLTPSATNVATWHAASGNPYTGSIANGSMWWGTVTATTTETFTLSTTSGGPNYFGGACAAFAGTPSSGWDQQTLAGASFTSTASPASGTTGTTAVADELAVAGYATSAGGEDLTGTNGWTCPSGVPSSIPSPYICYQALTSTGTQQFTGSTGGTASGSAIVGTIE